MKHIIKRRKYIMRKVFTILAATMFAGAAFADTENVAVPSPVLSGEVALTFSQDATTDNWGGAMGLDLGVDAAGLANIDLDFSATDGNAVKLDNWTVGTAVAGVEVAIGDDNGVFVDAEGNQTLAAPAMTESVAVSVGDASVAVGFTDWGTDITDISNIQGAYTLGEVAGLVDVTASGDYNMDSENIVIGGAVSGLAVGEAALGGAVTYDVDAEKFAFEGTADIMGLTAYANGDQDDALQNIGGEYTYNLGGAELTAGGVYNMDAEELTPTVGVSFSF
jgi:hypothetical protein